MKAYFTQTIILVHSDSYISKIENGRADCRYLTVIPKKLQITRQRRHKYKCGKCYSNIKTAPTPSRIKPGGSYSDEMIIDGSACERGLQVINGKILKRKIKGITDRLSL